ncbi:protein jag [Micrococcus sp.]|uniref:Jag family protein n=1 Tax=Micrococcus sp. TaxID=1271 RepID=UPI002A919AF7|nr:R3H domain-containing nucleic acid-binding protein [Micrococcus sp.]MDY6055948.1 R3H domain-containing nucleic acid-binding protein [Micrococcus sp.]
MTTPADPHSGPGTADGPEEAAVVAGAEAPDTERPAEDAQAEALRRLEEEGDVAADYVEELLDIADLDGDIDIEVREGRAHVSVVAEDADDERLLDLVGPDGKTLEALQELVRLAVLTSTGHRSRLILDIAGHRRRRDAELRRIAGEAVERARSEGETVHLDPMGAYERKIVHDVVAEAGLVSESEGEGPRRHVVIGPHD